MSKRSGAGASILLGLMCFAAPAAALVGPATQDATFAPHVVMVLKRDAHGAGFCTGIVVARDVILTAAHCAADAANLRIHLPGGDASGFISVAQTAVNPGFRPDAPRTRERSIDLALLRTASPLPANLRPVAIDWASVAQVGTHYQIAGFGLTREQDGRTGGTLRSGTLAARAPLSNILLWAEDPQGKGLGACTGDSGGPVFTASGDSLVAVTVWSTGAGKKACGAVTQAAWLAPQRGWFESVLRGWSAR
ncbi:MAG: peptidase and chymotrypsin/Hap [Hyphomicrobiales bacterium]|nr:peptidase and chymotrypsin/Hap [Hyphomicrobiales bacterium]